MKKIFGFGLFAIISGGLMGCTTTDGNANLRNANSNTGYVTNATPTPAMTSSPMMNSNMNGNSNMKTGMNTNSHNNSNMNSKTNAVHN